MIINAETGKQEEPLEKYLDHLVSTNDDKTKAIRQLLDIQLEEVPSASVQPLAEAEATNEVMNIFLEVTEEEPLEEHLEEKEMRMVADETEAYPINEPLSISLEDTEEEPLEKHLDFLVSKT
ncbi:hypothetical protein AOLI_G00257580 [Acnodon oligacanthus]